MDVKTFAAAAQLPPGWDNLLPEDHYLKKTTLEAHEAIALPDVTYHYQLAFANGKPVAAAAFQVLRLRKEHFRTEALGTLQRATVQALLSTARPKLLVAGHLFRHDISTFYTAPDILPYEAYKMYEAAIDKALRLNCASAVLVKDMPELLIPYFANHAPHYLPLRNDISMQLDIGAHWQSIDDYEKDLKHKYAQRYRKIRKQGAALEFRELSAADVTRLSPHLFGLYEQVARHQQVRLGLLNEAFLPALKHFYNGRLIVWAITEDGRPVGFASAWDAPGVLDMFYIGFDYNRNSELQLYFNILFHGIAEAVERKKQKLILGRTALEAKARVGCRPHYLNTFLYIRNPAVRRLVAAVQGRVQPNEGEWEQRHPFKSQQD